MCTLCYNDENTRKKIAAYNTAFHEVTMHGVSVLPTSHAVGVAGSARVPGTPKHRASARRCGAGPYREMTLLPDRRFLAHKPGLNRKCEEFLAKQGAIMIGANNLPLEQTPADPLNFFPLHTYLLAKAGVSILKMVCIAKLAAEKSREFVFFRTCIKRRGATGTPIWTLAMGLS